MTATAIKGVTLFPLQDEQAFSDLRRGSAVWDGKRFMAEETLKMGKVRQMFYPLSLEVTIRKQCQLAKISSHLLFKSLP